MNKVITINLAGNSYQLEEAGYEALQAYLENAAARLANNPDRDEIISDIERAIGDKFRALLNAQKNVVETKEVGAVIAEMGPIEAEPGEAAGSAGAGPTPSGNKMETGGESEGQPRRPKRLYTIREGAMLFGVCNGLGAYFNIDPTIVRLAFVALAFAWGAGVLAYIIMAIVIPEARTPEEKACAYGSTPTAQEFIRRAKAGYYEAMKRFPDKEARREWKRKVRREMHGWGRSFAKQALAHAEQWRQNWPGYGAGPHPYHLGMGATWPLLSLQQGIVTVAFICALVSLLSTSTIFGLVLPAKVPVWLAAFILLMVYGILSAPMKAARRVFYCGYGHWPLMYLVDATIWLAVVFVLLWLAVHYFPAVREAVHAIPGLAHQCANDLQTWWKNK